MESTMSRYSLPMAFGLFLMILIYMFTRSTSTIGRVVETNNLTGVTKYVVMVDAGSSGSRIHVYHYQEGTEADPIPTFETTSKTMKTKPGLSHFEEEPEDSLANIKILLEFAQKHVPDSLWSSTSIYLFATAGLRTIRAGVAEEILDLIRGVLHRSPFHFESHWARLIPGRDEGMYGWIAANYLDKKLKGKPEDTVGVLEMGGASMQVSFVPHDRQNIDQNDLVTVKLGKHIKFDLYTHSYLNYGLEQAQHLALKNPLPDSHIGSNPCYPKGKKFEDKEGRGDYNVCKNWISHLVSKESNSVKKKSKCDVKSCTFSGVYQPHIKNEKFYAIENFFYTSEFFKADSAENYLDVLKSGGSRFCSATWDSLVSENPKEPPDDLYKYCFSSAYIELVLKDGLKIKEPHSSVKIVKKINGAAVDWSLGAVIHAVANKQMTPSSSECTEFSSEK